EPWCLAASCGNHSVTQNNRFRRLPVVNREPSPESCRSVTCWPLACNRCLRSLASPPEHFAQVLPAAYHSCRRELFAQCQPFTLALKRSRPVAEKLPGSAVVRTALLKTLSEPHSLSPFPSARRKWPAFRGG